EAMNQMMGSATNVMADALAMDIEVSPPACSVIEDAVRAREMFSDCAFCARFHLRGGSFDADVMQLVPAAFAEHLREAVATAEAAQAVVAGHPAGATPLRAHAPVREASAGAHEDALLRDVKVRLSAELGRARLPVGRAANLPPGAVIKL